MKNNELEACDNSKSQTATDRVARAKPTTRRRWKRWLLAASLVLFVSAYWARGLLLPHLARFLNVGQKPVPVDYAMVLGGGVDSRPFVAAALYRAGMAKAVIFGRSKLSPANEDGIYPPEDVIISRTLDYLGVPSEAKIRLSPENSSTRDEARSLAAFLESQPHAKVAVVTTSYHTRRTRRVFRRELGSHSNRVIFLGVPTESFSEDNWWQSSGGYLCYLNEYCKSAYYLVRY